jgi:hypothetical protein
MPRKPSSTETIFSLVGSHRQLMIFKKRLIPADQFS